MKGAVVKKTQAVTFWLLPLMVIGGLFFPLFGILAMSLMVALMFVAYFKKGRYWCGNICPRGAFLDIGMSKITMKNSYPTLFSDNRFRFLVFVSLMGFLMFRIVTSTKDINSIGAIFVSMCLITTIIAIILAVFYKPRGWCKVCPMGLVQEKIGKMR